MHLSKIYRPINFTEDGIVMSTSERHSLKTNDSRFFTEEGIEMFFNEVHLIKERASIVFIKEGDSKVTSSSDVQNEKQFCLIEVTEEGISILLKLLHFSKQLHPI